MVKVLKRVKPKKVEAVEKKISKSEALSIFRKSFSKYKKVYEELSK